MDVYLPIANMSVDALVIIGLGGLVGFLSGMFGVGGGFLTTPLLIFYGIPPTVAAASASTHRYALRPGGKRRMELYLRVSGALPNGERNGVGDAEFAFGASARPFESVPVALAVEQRIGIGGDALNRPAAYAITQIPPIGLPLDGKASAYAQFGMVGIDKPQLFFDTQILAERQVAKLGKIELSAGAGLWSGGQTGRDDTEADIYRLDIGPRASAVFPVGQGRARLSLGYRARVAGNADPGSGPALTLSTDF